MPVHALSFLLYGRKKRLQPRLCETCHNVAVRSVLPSWSFATQADTVPLEQYLPEYFNASEWAFIIAATARLIPSEGDGPGAYETRVPVFIDRQLASSYGLAVDWYMQGPHVPDAPLSFIGRDIELGSRL